MVVMRQGGNGGCVKTDWHTTRLMKQPTKLVVISACHGFACAPQVHMTRHSKCLHVNSARLSSALQMIANKADRHICTHRHVHVLDLYGLLTCIRSPSVSVQVLPGWKSTAPVTTMDES